METEKQSVFTGKFLLTITVTAVVTAVVCTGVLKVMGVDSSSAIVAGITGAITATVGSSLMSRKVNE